MRGIKNFKANIIMKKIILYILFATSFFCCKGQQIPIDIKYQDILVFAFKKNNSGIIKYIGKIYGTSKNENLEIESNINTEVFNTNNNIGIAQRWMGYGSHYIHKNYTFVQQKDTMSIECRCGEEINYFLKNIAFQKGKFKLEITPKKIKISGNQIQVPKEVQNLLFKNSYMPNKKPVFQDAYFKI